MNNLTNPARPTSTYARAGYIQACRLVRAEPQALPVRERDLAPPFQRRRLLLRIILAGKNGRLASFCLKARCSVSWIFAASGMNGRANLPMRCSREEPNRGSCLAKVFGEAAGGTYPCRNDDEDTRFASQTATLCDFAEALAAWTPAPRQEINIEESKKAGIILRPFDWHFLYIQSAERMALRRASQIHRQLSCFISLETVGNHER